MTWKNAAVGLLALIVVLIGIYALRPVTPVVPPESAAQARPAAPIPTAVDAPIESAFFIGDSLTVGWHAKTEADGYRALVASKLDVKGDSSAIAGATLAEVAAVTKHPKNRDLVIVELGTNDAAQGTNVDDFRTDYVALLNDAQTASPNAQLVCMGVWYPFNEPATSKLDDSIADACKEAGGRFVPLTTMFNAEGARGPAGADTWAGSSDIFHPNNTGHQMIADKVLAAIR